MIDYYTLLHYYYNINKLSVNADTTELMTIAKRNMRQLDDTVYLTAINYIIKPKDKKIGYIVSNDLSHDPYISSVISKIKLITEFMYFPKFTDIYQLTIK